MNRRVVLTLAWLPVACASGSVPAEVRSPPAVEPVFATASSAPVLDPTPPEDGGPPAPATVVDSRPFTVNEAQALAKVRAFPEARGTILYGPTWDPHPVTAVRQTLVKQSPVAGCRQGEASCFWVITDGVDAEIYDRTFYVDPRSGEVTAMFDEAWNQTVAPRPVAWWRSAEARNDRGWKRAYSVAALGLLGHIYMGESAPDPLDCANDDKTSCTLRFEVCFPMGSVNQCGGPNESGFIATFFVDDPAGVVTVASPALNGAEGDRIPVDRWRALWRSEHGAARALEAAVCQHQHVSVPEDFGTDASVARHGCGERDASCAWLFSNAWVDVPQSAISAPMEVDAKTHAITIPGVAGGPPKPFAAWCASLPPHP
jgi:hypothetical protein